MSYPICRAIRYALTAAAVVQLAGCADAPVPTTAATRQPAAATQDFIATQPAALQPYFRQLYREGDRNAVLNFDRLGVAALVQQQYGIAEKAFDQAIARIEGIRLKGSDLDAAKSKFSEEASKDFKGEPYEKAMAYYYRGVLYLHAGDFSNAGASFAQVNVEDSVAEKDGFKGDYASTKLLNAWTLNCLGNGTASAEVYRQALQLHPQLQAVSYREPTLFIVETGRGPTKMGTGKYRERLTWTDPGADATSVSILANGTALAAPVRSESLYYQATTRGGRPVEYILAGKASFKDGAQTASDVSAGTALVATQVANMKSAAGNYNAALSSDYLAAGAALFSVFSAMASSNTTPAADTRGWESLPASIWLSSAHLDAQALQGVSLSTSSGAAGNPGFSVNKGQCSIAWAHLGNLPSLQADPAEKIDSSAEAQARLKRFQSHLPGWF